MSDPFSVHYSLEIIYHITQVRRNIFKVSFKGWLSVLNTLTFHISTFNSIHNIFLVYSRCVLSIFYLKSVLNFYFQLLSDFFIGSSDFFIGSALYLISQSCYWYLLFSGIGLAFGISMISRSSILFGKCYVFVCYLGRKLGLGLDFGMNVGMDNDDIVKIFSCCCTDIFS